MNFVDEHDELPFPFRDFFQHGFEPLFELAAKFCACDQRAEIEREEPLVLEAFGDVAVNDALREAFGDRRLAHTRLADENRVVLGAAREYLNDAADFFVAPDYGIELPFACRIGQVSRVALQRLVLVLRGLVCDAVRAADRLERRQQRVVCRADAVEKIPALRALHVGQREEEMLGRNELIPQLLRVRFRLVEYLVDLSRERRLRIRLFRVARHLPPYRFAQLRDPDAELLQDRNDDSLVLGEEGEQKVQVVDEGVPRSAREVQCFVEGFGRFDGEAIWIDHGVRGGRTPRVP